ncbi:MAG: hypothetical protein PHP01_06175, partial [Phycisphaerae bacterium]|nr:hypothetical protein [Phycisphaerae bacterium]
SKRYNEMNLRDIIALLKHLSLFSQRPVLCVSLMGPHIPTGNIEKYSTPPPSMSINFLGIFKILGISKNITCHSDPLGGRILSYSLNRCFVRLRRTQHDKEAGMTNLKVYFLKRH